jgi:hypothetical protein
MTNPIAVDASDLWLVEVLLLFLWASLRDVTQLVAVGATRNSPRNNLATVLESSHVLIVVGRPQGALSRARRQLREAVRHRKLFIQVTLQVHVGERRDNVLLLDADQEYTDVLGAKQLLKLGICSLRDGFDVHPDGLLDVVNVFVGHGFAQLLEGLFRSDISHIVANDLARIFAFKCLMTWLKSI